jgi:hypothetical protein
MGSQCHESHCSFFISTMTTSTDKATTGLHTKTPGWLDWLMARSNHFSRCRPVQ